MEQSLGLINWTVCYFNRFLQSIIIVNDMHYEAVAECGVLVTALPFL